MIADAHLTIGPEISLKSVIWHWNDFLAGV
jgi:hypothetical protein